MTSIIEKTNVEPKILHKKTISGNEHMQRLLLHAKQNAGVIKLKQKLEEGILM